MQPAGEGQGAVLYIEGEVVDVEAAGGHHLQGLVVLDLTLMPNIHVRDIGRFPHVHTGQGRRVSLGVGGRSGPGEANELSAIPQDNANSFVCHRMTYILL